MAPLEAKEDHYDGMIIDPDSLPSTVPEFTSALSASCDCWQQQGKRGIWLKVPLQKAALIAPAVEHSGEFGQAEDCTVAFPLLSVPHHVHSRFLRVDSRTFSKP